jgi:ABC-type branched-subunit amino acid transport system permease subunit
MEVEGKTFARGRMMRVVRDDEAAAASCGVKKMT